MSDPVQPAEPVTLRDGSRVLIRPIAADDKPLLRQALRRLSPESRYRRFLAPKGDFTAGELAYLTEVDHRDHEALVATGEEGEELLGVARYIRLDDEPAVAEVAIAVVDDWQGRGLGTSLLERLIERGRAEGVERFRAIALAWNRDLIELLTNLGATEAGSENGLLRLDLELDRPRALRGALRGAAEERMSALPVPRPTKAGG